MIINMFTYSFVIRAFVVGICISICASLVGVSLISKKYSMIGDGLSHVAFGTLAIASVFNVAPLYVSMPVVLVAAFFLLQISGNKRINGDSAIAVISSSALALGIIAISSFSESNVDLSSYMFGSILALSESDMILTIVLSLIIITLYILFYHKISLVTIDETFSDASGIDSKKYNMLIALLCAIIIVLGMKIMGTLLISSILVFPGLAAMSITKTYRSSIILSTFISVIGFVIGLILSYTFTLPTGASIVVVLLIILIITSLIKSLLKLS